MNDASTVAGANDREMASVGGALAERGVGRAGVAVAAVVRAVSLLPAVEVVASRRIRPKRPALAAATVLVSLADLAWLARAATRSQGQDLAVTAALDTTATLAALALASGSGEAEVVGSLAGGLAIGNAATLGLIAPLPVGVVGTTAVAAAAALLARRGLLRSSWEIMGSSVVSFFIGGRVARHVLERHARDIDAEQERREEDQRQLEKLRTTLAVQRERESRNRVIHQHALQVLELVAGKWDLAPERVAAYAEREATFLRRSLEGDLDDRPATIGTALRRLAHEFGQLGLEVEVEADGVGGLPVPDHLSGTALVHATREALTNVLKHAGVARARVAASCNAAGDIAVTVTDDGRGFHQDGPGRGLQRDVHALMAEAGGSAAVRSRPGVGTSIDLRIPADAKRAGNTGETKPST